jgi:hypothetical protein
MKAAFWLLLQYLSLVPLLPHLVLRFVIRAFWRFERWWTRAVYYRATVARRRVAGEPLWKEVDLTIGIEPPPGHPYWDKVAKIEPLIGTVLHGTDDSEQIS